MADQNISRPMLTYTRVLQAPRVRIGRISSNITLPRSIELRTLLVSVAGAFAGLILALPFLGIYANAIFLGPALGLGSAYALLNLQPLEGEGVGRFLTLKLDTMRRKTVELYGDNARVFVGVAPISRVALGKIRMYPGSIEVNPDAYDKRGVPIIISPLPSAGSVMSNHASLPSLDTAPSKKVPSSKRLKAQKPSAANPLTTSYQGAALPTASEDVTGRY